MALVFSDNTGGMTCGQMASVLEVIKAVPSAQPEKRVFGNMSDAEFEKWLYEHGICHPDIHESISCDVVPLLIDNAISELPSAPRWIPVTERLPDVDIPVLVTDDAGGWTTIEVDKCGVYDESDERFWYTSQNVTAWMPLPKPWSNNVD